jgi:hypothetical protein
MTPLDEYLFLAFAVSTATKRDCIERAKQVLHDEQDNWSFSEGQLDISSIYGCAPPSGGGHLPEFVIWEPSDAKGVAFFSNLADGWPLFVRGLSRSHLVPFVNVRISNDLKHYPVCSMTYWVNGMKTRSIQVLKDDGWQFFENGMKLPFEKQEYYSHSRIQARLTKGIVLEYLSNSGWDVRNAEFWKSNEPAFYGRKIRHK